MSSVNSGMVIRPAVKGDADLLAAIHEECFANYWNSEAFINFFSVHNTHAIIAEIPSSLAGKREGYSYAGMVVFRLYPDEAEIITLAVRPGFRRQGFGRALLEKAMKEAGSVGLKAMFLDVEEGNEAALTLYKTQGFTLINRRRQYYRQKDGSYTDALVLRGKLG